MTEIIVDVLNKDEANPCGAAAAKVMASEKPVYRLKEVCNDGGFGLSTAWKYIKAGRIQTIKMGNRRCLTAAERNRILTEGF